MYELACHAWAFNDLPLEQAVQTIARMGFNYIDLGSGPHLDIDAAARAPQQEAARIRALLDRFHLQLTDLYLLLPELASPDEGRRLYEVKLFTRLIPFAVALGAPGITLSPGIEPPEPEPDPFATHPAETTGADPLAEMVEADEENGEETILLGEDGEPLPPPPVPFDFAQDSLRRCVEALGDAELRLSIEPHLDSVAATPQRALAMVEAVPGLSITLDWAHFVAQGIVSREVDPLLPHVAHAQFRQAARNRLQTPFNEGTLDLRYILTRLVEAGYRGAFCIEYMKTTGWHGMAALDVIREAGQVRNLLRTYRRALLL